MLHVGPYLFKKAKTSQEFEQIHRLNYKTFVDEIPQHPDPGTGLLIDKFHDKNSYFIVLCQGQVIGMLSAHDQPPYSVADRLDDSTILHCPEIRPLEVRLLAVEPSKRNSTVFFGLIWTLYEHALARGYTHLFISGLKERLPLYTRLGFEPLGPAVPCGNASFIPMALTVGHLPPRVQRTKERWEMHVEELGIRDWESGIRKSGNGDSEVGVNSDCLPPEPLIPDSLIPDSPSLIPDLLITILLPGPVTISQATREAFQQPPIYHRGAEFIDLFQDVRQTLGKLVGGRDVALFNGSGTLANEAVAATLAAGPGKGRGLILVNGEFGRRLAEQALRFGLHPRLLEWPWGRPWDLEEIEAALDQEPEGSWVWGVHLESSTGVLNDLSGLVRLARSRGLRVCADCISSLGAVPLDLWNVYLATGTSGKSLGSYAGVAMVFAGAAELTCLDPTRIPSYFDIAAALANEGPRYTFPSPLLKALTAALGDYHTPRQARVRYETYASLGTFIRRQLREFNLEPLADESCACPVVTTFAPPEEESSAEFVARCRSWGFEIGGQSSYLAERRLVQIAGMGAVRREDCSRLFERLRRWLALNVSQVG